MADSKDPTPEIYEAMDRAGLVAAHLLTNRQSMEKIVAEIRTKMTTEMVALISRREQDAGRHTTKIDIN
jgi:hypothetical protein